MSTNALALVMSAALLAGCAGMADSMSKVAGLGVVKQETSTFDNATLVSVTPQFLNNKGTMGNDFKLGARWTSATPSQVGLILSYSSDVKSGQSYASLTGLDVNLDGEISTFKAGPSTNLSSSSYNTVSKTIYTSSENVVVIPYATLERMVSAKDCRLRIHSRDGYEDSLFSVERIPCGQGTAILSIQEFMAKVAATRR
jgi:hypothetical protein